MADYLFVPHNVLDRWSEQGRVAVDGTILTLLSEKRAFALTSAVRFLKMEAGEDQAGLLHKVKTTEALKALGAEHYRESVLLGEAAYQVQEGFLADAQAVRLAGAQPGAPAPKPGEKTDEAGDGALERYLLDNL